MKRITRMLVFTFIAIYMTSLWNKGFTVNPDIQSYLKAVIVMSIVYYLVIPLAKILLLPLNLLSLGMVSSLVYFGLFIVLFHFLPIIRIKEWVFPGVQITGFNIPSYSINYWQNVIASSVSVSYIINLLELLV